MRRCCRNIRPGGPGELGVQGRSRERDALRRLRRDLSGSTAIEYALVAGLIFLALTTSLSLYGDSAGGLYSTISTRFLAAIR